MCYSPGTVFYQLKIINTAPWNQHYLMSIYWALILCQTLLRLKGSGRYSSWHEGACSETAETDINKIFFHFGFFLWCIVIPWIQKRGNICKSNLSNNLFFFNSLTNKWVKHQVVEQCLFILIIVITYAILLCYLFLVSICVY